MNLFEQLGLSQDLVTSLSQLGYEKPTPVQEQCIPVLLNGKNLIGQAQTGTGKTAAFALPILQQVDSNLAAPQALILTPTRELAIQVAESFQSYAKHMRNFRVLPIYGGQSFHMQLKALSRGAHIIVGTPGRIMDHMRREKIDLTHLKTFILDEADEMLNMGFVEDIEWIMGQIKHEHQIGLFSATMPNSIKKVIDKYIPDAVDVKIKLQTDYVVNLQQFYTIVAKQYKIEALTRFLEIEEFDAAIIFTRTKVASSELADKLNARGYSAAAINGDLSQDLREKVIDRLKRKNLDIVVATEVAARGLDIQRLSLVVNYDCPTDPESYVHRIGRTGRAGRSGRALLFIEPREKSLLNMIERVTKQKLELVQAPTIDALSNKRTEKFIKQIIENLTHQDIDHYRELVEKIAHDHEISELDIAASLALLSQKSTPLKQTKEPDPMRNMRDLRDQDPRRDFSRENKRSRGQGRSDRDGQFEEGMTRCRIEVGHNHDVRPQDIVGLIANKSGIKRNAIGKIDIRDEHSLVDIAEQHVQRVIKATQSVKLKQVRFGIKLVSEVNHRAPKKDKPAKKRQ